MISSPLPGPQSLFHACHDHIYIISSPLSSPYSNAPPQSLFYACHDHIYIISSPLPPPHRCPICMVDFAVGEHIRLLPCMHFYHMRCIDEWLLRSYCCPSCMERVDVGMHHTLTSVDVGSGGSSTHHHHSLRRRRRRRDRGSSVSSTVSVEAGPEPRGAGPEPRRVGQDTKKREFSPRLFGHSSGHGNYLTDQSVPGCTGQSGHGSIGQVEGASAQFLNNGPPEFEVRPPLSQDEFAYSMHSITFNDTQITNSPPQQGAQHLSTPSPVGATPPGDDVGMAPFSPPVFEYHFEYPSTQ